MSRRYNYLLKNIGLLTLSNFGSKILVFLMVPLYTSVLSTSDYGTYDLFNTTISLLIPIISINISEGVLRFALDEKNDSSIVYSIGWNIIIKGFLVVVLGIIFNNIFNIFPLLKENSITFLLLYLSTIVYQFLSSFIRGIDKVSILSIAAILNTISILGFNILFLIIIPLGLVGYFWSNILGLVLPSFCLLYTSDAADEARSVDLGGRRIIKKKKILHLHRPHLDHSLTSTLAFLQTQKAIQ
ncbi:oligosaccharide flippase family protein [Streptococcus pneumoniae D39]|nr:oligosaccharide flippase family protein [Streptococcus pneumoniae D39]